MNYRPLGTPELQVSAIGFGGWPMSGLFYGPAQDDAALRALQRALDVGINLFDTAAGYGVGHSEQLMGKALAGHRDDVIIVTKGGNIYDPEIKYYARDSRYETILANCDESLRNLGTDYVDLYLVHWPDYDTPIEEPMRAFDALRAQGKIRFGGVSNFTPDLLEGALAAHPIVADQLGYHMLDRRHGEAIIPYCREHGLGVMAYGSLAHGMLTGAFTAETRFDDDDWRIRTGHAFGLPLFLGDHFAANVAAVDRLKPLARRAGVTLPQLALRWVLREPAVTTALVGCRNPEEVDAAVAALEADIPDDAMREADAITAEAYQRMLLEVLPWETVGPVRRTQDSP